MSSLWLAACISVLVPTGVATVGDVRVDPAANGTALDIDPRSEALLAALRGNEQQIRSLTWTQRTYLPPCVGRLRRTWTLLEEGERYIDEQGRWLRDTQEASSAGPPTWELRYSRGVRLGFGSWRMTCDAEQSRGMLTQDDGFFVIGSSLWRVMGRALDYSRPRLSPSLGELSRSATEVRYLTPTVDEPWPGLEMLLSPGLVRLRVTVRLDPDYGYAVRLIKSVNALTSLPVETMLVTEFQRDGQISIPKSAVHAVFERIQADFEPSAQKREELELAVEMSGLPQELLTDEMRRGIARLTRPLDGATPAGSQSGDTELVSPQVILVDRVEVNKPRSLADLVQTIPADTKIFDGLTGKWIAAFDAKQRLLAMEASGTYASAPGDAQHKESP